MQLAIFSDEISQDFERALDIAQEYGCVAVELRSAWDKSIAKITDDEAQRMRTALDQRELKVCAIGSPFGKCYLDHPDEVTDHFKLLERCCELARCFETRMVRGFTYWRTPDIEAQWPRILKLYQRAADIAKASDCVIGVENEPSCHVGIGRQAARFVRELGRTEVGITWDPANSLTDMVLHEVPYPDGYAQVKDLIVHVHIKDYGPDSQGKMAPAPFGEGLVNFPGQLRALKAHGYTGYLSVETHWRPKDLPETELNRPGGATFSKDGEYASRLYLERFSKLLSQILSEQ